MTLFHWFIYMLSQRLVAGSVYTVRQLSVREFCLCDQSHEFKLACIRASDRSDNDFHKINRVTRGELLQRLVPATCRSDISPSVSRL